MAHIQDYLHGIFAFTTVLTVYLLVWRRRILLRLVHERERALLASDARLRCLFDATDEALLITDACGNIVMVNQQIERLLGYTTEESLGQSIDQLVPTRSRANHPILHENVAAPPSGQKMGPGLAAKVLRKDGSECDVEVSLSRIVTTDDIFFGCALRDITERRNTEEKIVQLAFYDQLTGLPNRSLLADRLKQTIAASSRSGIYGSLLFIDLDHFKTLNDTLGHDIGDLQLKYAATRLTGCMREGDTVARVGGDEFVVILSDLGCDEVDAATDTEGVAAKILASLNHPYQLGDVLCNSSASIGATIFKGQNASIETLMKQVDLAMYRAKDGGRNCARFFDPSMEAVVVSRAALEKDLRNAVATQQFVLHYQAQIEGRDRITGAEVLVRWHHAERGLVSPADFIPLAEEMGVILELGSWVLETACVQLERWAHRPAMRHLTLAVNVSALQFAQATFVDGVLAIVQRTGVNPKRLKLELTESLLAGSMEDIAEKMSHLKRIGISFSLDDFGTGYSSLSYLSRLPLDQLKIDKSFVNDVLINPGDAAIARTIIGLAESLNLGVIAEGVETQTQREFLATSGCDAYQGFLFSQPLPIEGFEGFFRSDGCQ